MGALGLNEDGGGGTDGGGGIVDAVDDAVVDAVDGLPSKGSLIGRRGVLRT